jgi:transcriptional regulator with XRE-family HTH domain
VDAVRLGTTFRALRIKKAWRQQDLATQAKCPRGAVSKLEVGGVAELEVSVVLGIAEALGATLDLVLRWHGGDLERLVNARHSQMHESVAKFLLAAPSWEFAPEVSFSIYGERGVIDILAWHTQTRTLLVIELKTEIVDVNDLMATADKRRRLAAKVARERGWDPLTVSSWVIVAESTTNRRRVAAHKSTLRTAFPLDGHAINAWLNQPSQAVAALSFWPYARLGGTKQGIATVKRVRRPRDAVAQA